MILTLLLTLATVAKATETLDFAGATIVVSQKATNLEIFAARELSRYFRLICGKPSPVVTSEYSHSTPHLLVGTALSFPTLDLPVTRGEQRYRLQMLAIDPPTLLVSGSEPVAVQYAAYTLLEKLGVGFYLGGDALPPRRETLLIPANLDETNTPIFKIRGSLPWYNFLNSPTTWDLEDYQFFFDQMAKMKMNFVGFHSYDHEPFCAYPWEGQWHMGAPAATSLTYGWGTIRHLATSEFGFGTGRYFPYEVFGSRSAVLAQPPPASISPSDVAPLANASDDAILRAQCVLGQGLQYGTDRGLHTCLGFELHGDPTDPELRRHTEARIRNMLATCPMLHYVWFWQQEGSGAGSEPPPPNSPLDLFVQRYRDTFAYLGNDQRIAEAARMTAWVQFAHRVVQRFRPDIRVIVSGWGGDRWMRFSDFYLGLDKVLPEDIIFAALDNIDPSWEPNVSAIYGKLSPRREKWPIPWFESDGGGTRRDQWGPQCNVKPFTHLVRDAQNKHCEGLLGIHWQTRGVEEVAAYVAQFAWNPDLTYEDFYADFARKCYGEQHGPEMAQIHMQLEALGPRLTGSLGQVECGRFNWFSSPDRPKAENLEKLRAIVKRLKALDMPTYTAWERRNYLQATIEFLLAYDEAALMLASDGPVERLLQQAETAKTAGNEAEAKNQAEQALKQMASCPLATAMQIYATRLTTQGDWGNLATINVKAYAAFLELWERAEALLGEDRPLPETPTPQRRVLVKPIPSAVPEGVSLPVYLIAPHSEPTTKHILAYRTPGQEVPNWVPMAHVSGTLFVGRIPSSAIGPQGLELQIQAYLTAPVSGELGKPLAFWPDVTAWHSVSAFPSAGPVIYGPYLHRNMALAPWWANAEQPTTVRCTVLPAEEYGPAKVELTVAKQTLRASNRYHAALFPLSPELLGEPMFQAKPSARDGMDHIIAGEAIAYAPPRPPEPPGFVSAKLAGPFLVRLEWEDVPTSSHFQLHRSEVPSFAPTAATLLAEWPWPIYDDIYVRPNVTYEYAVIAIDELGQRSEPIRSTPVAIPDFPLAAPPTGLKAIAGPGRISLTWDHKPDDALGYAVFVEQDGQWHRISGDEPFPNTQYVVSDLIEGNEYRFRIHAIDRAERLGEPSEPITAIPLPVPHEPVFMASFDTPQAQTGQTGVLHGKAKLSNGVLDVREGGWIAYPNQKSWQVTGPLSVEFWANIDRIEAIPVMLSFGHWEGPGYWMQLIGGHVRWYLPRQKYLDGGAIALGSWHHLCGTYDGTISRLYIDGEQVANKFIGQIDLTPWPGELRIGMYSDIDRQFQTYGQLDEVRIYQRTLPADEVKQHFVAGRNF
ncbi:MAG: LamG-like jellyroll fold domain-containing protein [Candidatus Zipacnadales bacterium]